MSNLTKVYIDITIDNKNAGRIVFVLYPNTPITAKNFASIAAGPGNCRDGDLTYTGSVFHRIVPNFLIHGGDITRYNGTGGISIYGSKFQDEKNGLMNNFDRPFTLGMANCGPNTNGSQFFITTVPRCSWLNGKFVSFGHVIEGFDVVKKIESCARPDGTYSYSIAIVASGVL